MPDHSNLIFVYGRYTLDELIFKALYDQDELLYQALEPIEFDQQVYQEPRLSQDTIDAMTILED